MCPLKRSIQELWNSQNLTRHEVCSYPWVSKLFTQRLLFYRRRFSTEDRLIHNGRDGLNIPRRNKCLVFRRKLSSSRNHVPRYKTQSEMMERIINSIKRLFKCNRKMFSNHSAGKFLLLLKATILNTVAD